MTSSPALLRLALPALLAMLAACNSGTPTPAGGVSEGEAQALAEAAEMLDEERRLPDDAIPVIAEPEEAASPAQMPSDTAR
jgi:hypothetical protein